MDLLGIDTAHGHSSRVMEAIREVKRRLPEMQLVAGNVGTYEGTRDLISLGGRRRQNWNRPRLDLHHQGRYWGGLPQITAILEARAQPKIPGSR